MPKRWSPKEVRKSDINFTSVGIWKWGFFKITFLNVLKILLNKVLSSFLAEVETERDSFRDEMLKLKTDLVTLGSVYIMKYRETRNITTHVRFSENNTVCNVLHCYRGSHWITVTRKEKAWNGTHNSKWNQFDWTGWATGRCSKNQSFEAIQFIILKLIVKRWFFIRNGVTF